MRDIADRLREAITDTRQAMASHSLRTRDALLLSDVCEIFKECADAITELRERCAFYERTNAEQAAMLNMVIAERDELKEQVLRVVRGDFTQICSYCGWEAPPEGAQWEDLQAHIKVCPTHPAAQLAAVTAERDELKEKWDYYQQFCKDHGADGIGGLVVERDEYRAALEQCAANTDRYYTAKEVLAKYAPAHTDHPLRHYDRTCPTCAAEDEAEQARRTT